MGSRTPACISMPQSAKCVMRSGVCCSKSAREQKGRPVSSAYRESGTEKSSPVALMLLPVILKSSRVRKAHTSYECFVRQVSMTAAM